MARSRGLTAAVQVRPEALGKVRLRPVEVAILDSGIDASHPALRGRIVAAFRVEGGQKQPKVRPARRKNNDDYGHGTAVASIIARIAPNARLVDIRVLGPDNQGSGAALIEGLRFAVERGSRIINMSLAATAEFAAGLHALCETAYYQNQVVVAAKRNMPLVDNGFPAEFSSCIGVDNRAFPSPFVFRFIPGQSHRVRRARHRSRRRGARAAVTPPRPGRASPLRRSPGSAHACWALTRICARSRSSRCSNCLRGELKNADAENYLYRDATVVAVNCSTRCRFLSRTRTVILAVTNDCNMACSYCYQDSRFVPRGGKARLLPAEVARAALSDIVRTTSSRRVGVIFHGGEPTLAPQDWYREVVAPVSRLAARSGKSLQFHMQSNGQLIDDSWASCFRALAINVGISMDGPAEVSLPYRAGSENAARAVRVMQAHGLRPGAIVVATPRNLPVIGGVMSYLADLQLDGFHLLPWLAFGRFHDASDAAYRQMLLAGYIQVAETLLAHPAYPVEARLALYVSRFVGKPAISINATGCQSLRKPCGRQLVYLDETGGIYPCQSLHSDALQFGRATAKGIGSCAHAPFCLRRT